MIRVEGGDTKYYVDDCTLEFEEDNVTYITKNEFCKEVLDKT
jgi:hypothetical protein